MTATAETIKIVTDIAPIHSLVSQVAGDKADVALLLEQGADPHHYSLKPSQAKELENSDMVFWIGHELTPWLEKGVETLAIGATVVSLLHAEGTNHIEASEHHHHDHDEHEEHDEAKHDEHDEDKHDDHEEHAEEKGEHGEEMGIDAHAWLDPVNAQTWLGVIAAELSTQDPANADLYKSNAAAAAEELSALITEINDSYALPHDIPGILSHDFLGYFETRFDIELLEPLKSHDDEALGLGELTEAKEHAKEDGAKCLLYTPDEAPESFANFNEGLDLKLVPIDQLGAGQPIGSDLYNATLRGIADSLKACIS
ncbi:MAG: zinc ABC transporter substrate-binding protein [Pseudomonadota bacterium]